MLAMFGGALGLGPGGLVLAPLVIRLAKERKMREERARTWIDNRKRAVPLTRKSGRNALPEARRFNSGLSGSRAGPVLKLSMKSCIYHTPAAMLAPMLDEGLRSLIALTRRWRDPERRDPHRRRREPNLIVLRNSSKPVIKVHEAQSGVEALEIARAAGLST